MKNELAMSLISRRPLTEELARDQITALNDFDGGLLRPDKWSEFEPIKTPFNIGEMIEPVKTLAKPHGSFSYRKGRPTVVTGTMWNLTHSPDARFPSPVFTNYWSGEIDGNWAAKGRLERVEAFVADMFHLTGADFGLLTPQIDLEAKNTTPMRSSFKGLTFDFGVPGLYWINFFSDELADWLDLASFPERLGTLKRLPRGGYLIKFCEDTSNALTVDVLHRQRVAIDWLGADKFFDIRLPDRAVTLPDWACLSARNIQV
jgi:hypothetical protein